MKIIILVLLVAVVALTALPTAPVAASGPTGPWVILSYEVRPGDSYANLDYFYSLAPGTTASVNSYRRLTTGTYISLPLRSDNTAQAWVPVRRR